MSATRNDDGDVAERQVEAFLRVLNSRLGTDETTIQKIIERQQKNGRAYVTWGVVLTVLGGATTFLIADKLHKADAEIARISELQRDVRERLYAIEARVRDLKECK
jgi:hypothetical protein